MRRERPESGRAGVRGRMGAWVVVLSLLLARGVAAQTEDPFAGLSDPEVESLLGLLEAAEGAERDEDWAEALDYYRRAEAILPLDQYRFRQAHCLEAMGETVRALLVYRELAHSDVEGVARTSAARLSTLENLADQLPTPVEIAADPPDLLVLVDGEEVGRAADGALTVDLRPGEHELVGRRAGFASVTRELQVAPATIHHVSLVLEPAEEVVVEEDGGGVHPASWALAGAAAGFLVGGTIFGILAEDRAAKERDYFTEGGTDRGGATALGNEAQDFALAANVGFIGGGVLAAVAVVSFFVLERDAAPDDAPRASLRPSWGEEGVGMSFDWRF